MIYPLLGRLLDERLIEETKDGKYHITKKGKATAKDVEMINNVVKKQLDVLFRLGNVGKFVAMDLIERVTTMGTMLSANVSNMTKGETEKYRKFLKSELEKLQKESTKKRKKIKIK